MISSVIWRKTSINVVNEDGYWPVKPHIEVYDYLGGVTHLMHDKLPIPIFNHLNYSTEIHNFVFRLNGHENSRLRWSGSVFTLVGEDHSPKHWLWKKDFEHFTLKQTFVERWVEKLTGNRCRRINRNEYYKALGDYINSKYIEHGWRPCEDYFYLK